MFDKRQGLISSMFSTTTPVPSHLPRRKISKWDSFSNAAVSMGDSSRTAEEAVGNQTPDGG